MVQTVHSVLVEMILLDITHVILLQEINYVWKVIRDQKQTVLIVYLQLTAVSESSDLFVDVCSLV